jgi:hypothetical protein
MQAIVAGPSSEAGYIVELKVVCVQEDNQLRDAGFVANRKNDCLC